MNYLTYIERLDRYTPQPQAVRFLVSGSDRLVRSTVLHDIAGRCREEGRTLVVIIDAAASQAADCDTIRSYGYEIRSGMSGEFSLVNPLAGIGTIKGQSRLRQLLATLGYNEQQKGKLFSYLNLIRHLERAAGADIPLTPEILGEYCTASAVEEKIALLREEERIDEVRQMMLLAKYAECASASADFEDMFYLLLPFIGGESIPLGAVRNQAYIFPLSELGDDITARGLLLQLLLYALDDCRNDRITVLILDRGYGTRGCLSRFLTSIPAHMDLHLLSEDVFTLCSDEELPAVLNRFTARLYSRHLTMSSAQAIERACGEIDVVKNAYNVTYDRRWRANLPWDLLMGNNKTETYTQTAPVREPRYRKEMIMSLHPGTGIVEYMGNASLFNV